MGTFSCEDAGYLCACMELRPSGHRQVLLGSFCVHGRVSFSLCATPLSARCCELSLLLHAYLCVCAYVCIFACTGVSRWPQVSPVRLSQGWPVCTRVLGLYKPVTDLQRCHLKIFSLFLSPASLIDMPLPSSLPKDHSRASSVWTESSVGLEKSTAAPPSTMSSACLRVGSRSCWREPPPSCCGQQRAPCAHRARQAHCPSPPTLLVKP